MLIPFLPSTFSEAPWLPIADAIVKASVLLGAAGLASIALRRASAASRHLVWTIALVGALVLPVLSLALPRWQLPLITLPGEPAASVAPLEDAVAPARPAPPLSRTAQTSQRVDAEDSPAASSAVTPSTPWTWPAILFAVWCAGATLVLARVAVGLVAVQWISRRDAEVTDAPWLDQAYELADALGVSPRLRFLRSGSASMPMACGLLRPAVVMPADADAWSESRLRIVLLHELAHVKRLDCLTHLVAQVACAFYWFNPLVWMAAKRIRAERERACDDLVLASGTRGPDYADQLLEIARVMRSGRFRGVLAGASLAMAQRSQLEGRLMAILDPNVPRSGVTRFRTLLAATVAACALMPLASMQPWVYAVAPSDPVIEQLTAQPTPAPQPAPQPGASAAGVAQPPVPETPRPLVAADHTARTDHGPVEAQDGSAWRTARSSWSASASASASAHAAAQAHVEEDKADHDDDDDQDKTRTVDPRMVTALTAALKDSDKEVRETALHALVQLRDPSVFEPLLQALKDAAPDVREQAAFGLGQLRDKRAVDALVQALKDAAANVREQAAFALGQIRDRAAAAALSSAIKDVNDEVREQVVFALGQLRDIAAVPGLAAALHDTQADVRQQAAFALGQIRDPKAVEPLISALKDPAPDVREQAAFALGQIRDKSAVEALVIALKDANADVREQAAFALGQIRDPRAIDGLTAALKDPSADVRQQAAFALGQLARSR